MDLQTRPDLTLSALTFELIGDVDQTDFVPWMERQANKLDVGFSVIQQLADKMILRAVGAPEMTHAFALACSLGPKSVQVHRLQLLEDAKAL